MLQLEHSAILLTFIKLPFVTKICVLSIFEWPLKTGLTVLIYITELIKSQYRPNLVKVFYIGYQRFLIVGSRVAACPTPRSTTRLSTRKTLMTIFLLTL